MRTDSLLALVSASLLLLSACGRDEQTPPPLPAEGALPAEAPANPAVPEAARDDIAPVAEKQTGPVPGEGTADLVLTGAIERELKGTIVTCGYTRLDGRDQGGTWAIRSDEFDFQIMATSDEDFAEPAALLNAKQPVRMSFVFKRKNGTVKAARDRTLAEIDADLHHVVGTEKVHVKGTMTCPPK
jgi:hypothetical protein